MAVYVFVKADENGLLIGHGVPDYQPVERITRPG